MGSAVSGGTVPADPRRADRHATATVAAGGDVVPELLLLHLVHEPRRVARGLAREGEDRADDRRRLAGAADLQEATTARDGAAVDVQTAVAGVGRCRDVRHGLGRTGRVRVDL